MPIVRLSSIEPRPVEWIWPGWIAAGHLHLFDGDPGVGKSFVTGDLAARVSRGRSWPDGAAGSPAAAAILLNAEDDAASTTHARLLAAGADMERILVWRRGDDPTDRLEIPGRLGPLREAIESSGARLVIIDPVTAFLHENLGMASDPQVRRALQPLADLADRTRCAIVMVRHLTKRTGGRALAAGLGSIGWIAACRLGWLAGPDPKIPGQAVLAPLKTNLGVQVSPLSYRLPSSTADAIQPESPAQKSIEWLGPSDVAACDIVARLGKRPSSRLGVRRFLQTLLQGGPRSSVDVHAAARRNAVSLATLRRAARDLNISMRRTGNQHGDQTVWWSMPPLDPELEALLDQATEGF